MAKPFIWRIFLTRQKWAMDQNLILSDCIFGVIVCENTLCVSSQMFCLSHVQHIPWTDSFTSDHPSLLSVGALSVFQPFKADLTSGYKLSLKLVFTLQLVIEIATIVNAQFTALKITFLCQEAAACTIGLWTGDHRIIVMQLSQQSCLGEAGLWEHSPPCIQDYTAQPMSHSGWRTPSPFLAQ